MLLEKNEYQLMLIIEFLVEKILEGILDEYVYLIFTEFIYFAMGFTTKSFMHILELEESDIFKCTYISEITHLTF
jgi:hypothetical protein